MIYACLLPESLELDKPFYTSSQNQFCIPTKFQIGWVVDVNGWLCKIISSMLNKNLQKLFSCIKQEIWTSVRCGCTKLWLSLRWSYKPDLQIFRNCKMHFSIALSSDSSSLIFGKCNNLRCNSDTNKMVYKLSLAQNTLKLCYLQLNHIAFVFLANCCHFHFYSLKFSYLSLFSGFLFWFPVIPSYGQ